MICKGSGLVSIRVKQGVGQSLMPLRYGKTCNPSRWVWVDGLRCAACDGKGWYDRGQPCPPTSTMGARMDFLKETREQGEDGVWRTR